MKLRRYIIGSAKAMVVLAGIGIVLLVAVGVVGMVTPARVGPGRFEGAMTVEYEPISMEQAKSLIEGGEVRQIAIRPGQTADEFSYLLHYEGIEDDSLPVALETTAHWKVNGVDVHVFTGRMSSGVPILSADGNSVGLASKEFENLLVLLAQYNARASSPIEVLDQRTND